MLLPHRRSGAYRSRTRRPVSAKSTRESAADLARHACLDSEVGGFDFDVCYRFSGTTGDRSCSMSFATGPSSSICARKATMQLSDPPSSVAANPKLPSGLWRRQPWQDVGARSLAPHPALWAAATALGLMERALILRQAGERLASQSHACPHRGPLATLQAHSSGEVARRREATATSGRTTLGLRLAVFHASVGTRS